VVKAKVKIDESKLLFTNKALAALLVPLGIEQFLVVLVGIVITIMVAHVGEVAVSGVALVDTVIFLFMWALIALTTGGAVIAGQYLGQRSREKGCQATDQMVWFTSFIGIGLMVLMYASREFLFSVVFGAADQEVLYHGRVFFNIVAASIPFIALYNAGAAIFRAMGNSKLPLLVSVIMNVINIVTGYVFIFILEMGTTGAGVAVLISRIISALIIIWCLCKGERQLSLSRTLRYRPDWKMIKRILKIGIPNGLENSLFQVGKILLVSLIASFGTYSIAANAVGMSIGMFQILPGIAASTGIVTVIARCVGAGDYDQAAYFTKKIMLIAIIAMAVVNGIILLFLPTLLSLYNLSNETYTITTQILVFHGVACIVIWPISFVLPGTLRAAGDVKVVMVISLITMWIFRIGFSYLLGSYFGMGLLGIWVAMVIDWIIRSVCFIIRYKTGKWRLIRSI
jgi:putative MATE family efflux protein